MIYLIEASYKWKMSSRCCYHRLKKWWNKSIWDEGRVSRRHQGMGVRTELSCSYEYKRWSIFFWFSFLCLVFLKCKVWSILLFFLSYLNLAWCNETSELLFYPRFILFSHFKISIHWEHWGHGFLIFRITWILHCYCNLWIIFLDCKERKKNQESIQNREHTDVMALWECSTPCLKLSSTRRNSAAQFLQSVPRRKLKNWQQ